MSKTRSDTVRPGRRLKEDSDADKSYKPKAKNDVPLMLNIMLRLHYNDFRLKTTHQF